MTILKEQQTTNGLSKKISQIDRVEDPQFLADVIQGLSKANKTLPCKYFYDEIGSDLFEQICDLNEYYVTETELNLLSDNLADIAKNLPSNCNIIEPGSGAGIKIQMLLSALDKPKSFTPLEISPTALESSVATIKSKFPFLQVNGMVGDFTDKANILKIHNKEQTKNVVFFPGSTIGNFEDKQAVSILENLALLSGNCGKILIGVDLIKPISKLLAAYNDEQGVTALFNKNLLDRINTELHGNFNVHNGFEHEAVFNAEKSRIEMHLISQKDQIVNINGIDFNFRKEEIIHTENSHKYSISKFEYLVQQAGLKISHTWFADQQYFGLFLLEK